MASNASFLSDPPHIHPPIAHEPKVIAETLRSVVPSCLCSIIFIFSPQNYNDYETRIMRVGEKAKPVDGTGESPLTSPSPASRRPLYRPLLPDHRQFRPLKRLAEKSRDPC